jgi:hypothetical protein
MPPEPEWSKQHFMPPEPKWSQQTFGAARAKLVIYVCALLRLAVPRQLSKFLMLGTCSRQLALINKYQTPITKL